MRCFGPSGWNGVWNASCTNFRGWYIGVHNRFGTGVRTFHAVGDPVFQFDTPARCNAQIISVFSNLVWSSAMVNTNGEVLLGSQNSGDARNTFQFYCELPGTNLAPRLGLYSVRVT